MLNAMVIRVRPYANVSKQQRYIDSVDVGPLKWHVRGCGCQIDPFMKV